MKDNIRTLLNALEYYEEHPGKQAAIIFYYAKKAFDNVSQEFMEEQLRVLLGEGDFVDMISSIY